MHSALAVYDVLNSIFQMLEPQDLHHVALVNSRWQPLAVRQLWREVSFWDLYQFFTEERLTRASAVAADYVANAKSQSKPSTDPIWPRFMSVYAPIIRKLDVSVLEGGDCTREQISRFIKMLPSDFRSSLSNLTDVRFCWSSDKELSLQRMASIFLSPTITSFTCIALSACEDEEDQLEALLDSLPSRMPRLQHLTLRSQDMNCFRSSFGRTTLPTLASALPGLRSIDLPSCLLSPELLTHLLRNPRLEAVVCTDDRDLGGRSTYESWQDVADASQSLASPSKSSWFKSGPEAHDGNDLRILTMCTSFHNMTTILSRARTRLCTLTTIDLILPSVSADASEIHAYSLSVASTCPALRAFKLTALPRGIVTNDRHRTSASSLTWQLFQPLRACTHLEELRIHWNTCSAFTDSDIAELAASWPDLEVLVLDFDHALPLEPWKDAALNVVSLKPLAERCPRLRELAIHLSPTVPGDADADLPSFHALDSLSISVGYPVPPRGGKDSLQRSLDALLPPTCELRFPELEVNDYCTARAVLTDMADPDELLDLSETFTEDIHDEKDGQGEEYCVFFEGAEMDEWVERRAEIAYLRACLRRSRC